jgi:hypothetical protein
MASKKSNSKMQIPFGNDKQEEQVQQQELDLWLKGSSGVLARAWWQVLRLRSG